LVRHIGPSKAHERKLKHKKGKKKIRKKEGKKKIEQKKERKTNRNRYVQIRERKKLPARPRPPGR
jgi:hypothetical protein